MTGENDGSGLVVTNLVPVRLVCLSPSPSYQVEGPYTMMADVRITIVLPSASIHSRKALIYYFVLLFLVVVSME